MIHGCQPSEYFLGAILRGYEAEAAQGGWVTVSGIWNRVVMECLAARDGFETMFTWDTRAGADKRNRIADIAEAIRQGYVPGLKMGLNGKGREIVVRGTQ
jgi:hypothetical protein